jgi:small-conductance mechanosensitive channel
MFHESLRQNSDSKVASPRAFGLTFAALFSVIGILPLLRHQHARLWSLIIGLVFLTAALLLPRVLEPLNRTWSLVGSLLHRVTTPVLMALVFVLVVTPVALLRKAVGSSGLALRFDSKLDSYWIPRDRAVADADSLKRQF